MQEAKYLVFLDIDGVFTSTRVQTASDTPHDMWNRFDPVAVSFLNRIADKSSGVRFVISSTWKNGVLNDSLMNEHWVTTAFRNAGFRGYLNRPWKTNPDDLHYSSSESRAEEIKDYLETYAPNVQDFLIIDDSDYGFNRVLDKKRFVKTDPHNGMLFKHMLDILSLIGNWKDE